MTNMTDILAKLCSADGVSGSENSVANVCKELLKPLADEITTDNLGNVTAILKSENKEAKTILLDAHIDEIGLIVTDIDDRGFIRFDRCGGIDKRLVSAQVVTIHGTNDITGVVGSKPPHLETDEEAKKAAELTDLYIDTGLSPEKVKDIVSLGDRITFRGELVKLLGTRVTAKALDDRCGVAVILRTLELLQGKTIDMNVAVSLSSREETGGQGAKVASYTAAPDFGIAVDVSFAKSPGVEVTGGSDLSKGVMIGYSATLDRDFSDTLLCLAKKHDIPHTIEVMGGGSTGTNADDISVTRSGVITSVLSIPLRYMHSPVEIIDMQDVESTARLIAEFILSGGKN